MFCLINYWKNFNLKNEIFKIYHMKKNLSSVCLSRKHLINHFKDYLVLYNSKLEFSNASNNTKSKVQGNFRNCIIVSRSKDIFENLAIEDWLYKYQDCDQNELLFIWCNKPSIVIGRHQNPWQEVNLDNCIKSNVSIARRYSGGGTVYHDENNLNICFFTSKREYNRQRNLEFIQDTIKTSFKIVLKINEKLDLVLDKTNEKVSGTASKLAYDKSYHHCTLLVDTNLHHLSRFIKKESEFIRSNATKSIYSPVKNLSAINPMIKINNVIDALVYKYKIVKQITDVYYVDFDELTFPTIKELRDELKDWNWIFGRTPKFRVIKRDSINGKQYTCELDVVKGLIDKVDLYKDNELLDCMTNAIKGKKLIIKDCESGFNKWLKTRNDFQSVYFSKLVLDAIRAIS